MGRKGNKKADFIDLPDADEEDSTNTMVAAKGDNEPVAVAAKPKAPAKKANKKKGKGKGGWDGEDSDGGDVGSGLAAADLDDEPARKPAGKSQGKGAAKGGKGSSLFAALAGEDDEESMEAQTSVQVEEEEEEEEFTPKASKDKKKKKAGKADAGSLFAALQQEEESVEPENNDENEDESVSPNVSAAKPGKDKRKKKGGKGDVDSLFDSLEQEAGSADGMAAEVPNDEDSAVDASAMKPGKDKKKKKVGKADVDSLFAALEQDGKVADGGDVEVQKDEDEAAEASAGMPGKDKKKKKGGKADMESLFASLEQDNGSPEAPDKDADQSVTDDASAIKPEKDKKKKKASKPDVDALFAALAADGGEADDKPESGETAAAAVDGEDVLVLGPKKKKKSAKAAGDIDNLLSELAEQGSLASSVTAPSEPALGKDDGAEGDVKSKGKKKGKDKEKKGKGGDDEFDALLAEPESDPSAPTPSSSAVATEEGDAGDKKKSKKKGKDKKGKGEDEDIDALLAEMGAAPAKPAPTPPAAAEPSAPADEEDDNADEGAGAAGGLTAAQKKKLKKKAKDKEKKAAGKGDEEDLDALLAELGAAPAKPQPAAAETTAAAPDAAAPEPQADDEDGEGGEGEVAAGGELTAAQKKKLKKKAKEKEKKAAGKAGEDADEADEAAAAPAPKKGGKPVKESPAVRKMREELERRKKAEEEAARAEEERRIKEEEEQRLMEEEEQRKKEESERKKADKKAKREQLKKEGKLLTGRAKEEAERLAAMREAILAKLAEKGQELPLETKSKKVVYAKKGAPKKTGEEAETKTKEAVEPAEQKVAVQAEEAVSEPAAVAMAAATEVTVAAVDQSAAAPEAEEEEDGVDDWEALDEVEVVVPPLKKEPVKVLEAAAAPAAAAAKQVSAPAPPPAPAVEPAAKPAQQNGAKVEEEEESESEEENEDDKGAESGSEEEGEEESSSEESGSEDESDEESDSDSDETSSSECSSSDDDSSVVDDAKERRLEEARNKRLARLETARNAASKENLRSPICCVLGHVDVGKTKILDNIRRTTVQEGEAGGITQQIGATFVPAEAIGRRTESLRAGRAFDMKLPGLLIIDTPGHESFTNLRSRGSGLCDLAVLIVDLMHGLEQQTIESINLLKMRKTPFIIALNKIDRLYGWKSAPDTPVRDSFKRQKEHVMDEFEDRSSKVFLQLNEQGLNVALYWKNPDPRKYVNVVPTSAVTGEGIPDLLQLVVKLTQSMMTERLQYVEEPQATVLEVKTMEGLGTTVDVVLVNGTLREGDRIVVCGMTGPIVSRIKALKTPQVLRELRIKGALQDHKEIRAAMGVKVVAPGLESAVAGTQMFVMQPEDDEEELKDAVMADMADIFSKVDKGGEGVCVQASTLGSLEALLAFLSGPDVNIAVSGINIGPIHKRDVLRANVMNEKKVPKYACILAFDVPVAKEARELAQELNVKIFTADIIYHLFDQFTAYLKTIKAAEQEAARLEAVFPCVLGIMPGCIFNKKDPIVLGVEVVEGIAKVGTPLCVPSKEGMDLGRIASLELNHKAVDMARAGQCVAMKIESTNAVEQSRLFGRHFDATDQLVSRISRESIDALKSHFADEMAKDDWRLVIKLKKVFQIV